MTGELEPMRADDERAATTTRGGQRHGRALQVAAGGRVVTTSFPVAAPASMAVWAATIWSRV
jgi:hypothetical protein